MANIKVFDTPSLGLRPSETGIDTVAGNARRIGSFYNQQGGELEQLAAQEGQAYRSVGSAVGGGVAGGRRGLCQLSWTTRRSARARPRART